VKLKYIIIVTIAILVLLNIFLSYRIHTLNTYIKTINSLALSEPKKQYSDLSSVPYFVLTDLDGKIYDIGELIKFTPYTMLVFFSLKDCAACLLEYELWKKISQLEMINVLQLLLNIWMKESLGFG